VFLVNIAILCVKGIFMSVGFYFRLERVRQRQEYNTEEPRMRIDGQVALFEDYAILDQTNSFLVGNLVCLVLSGSHSPVEYRRPVSYEDPKRDKITAYLQLYNRVRDDGVELRGVFELKSSEPKPFPFTDILTHVNLTVAEDNRLEMSSEELSAVENDVAKLLHPVPRRQNVRSTGNSARTQFASNDGIARIVVEPGPESSAGLRRSSRTRTAVFFNS